MGSKEHEGSQIHGFDAAIITLDAQEHTLQFAGAKGNLFLIRNGTEALYKGTRKSIDSERTSARIGQETEGFEQLDIQCLPGDQVYLYTDGITDQFGGPDNKKLGRRRLGQLLSQASFLPIQEREKAIEKELLIWKGGNFKVDDATLVGIEF